MTRNLKTALFFVLFLAGVQAGQGATITLHQGGWDTGGPLTITFTGENANADAGYETSELTSFHATFQLPGGGVASFSLPALGADGFFYGTPFDYFIKADNADFSLYEIADATDSVGIFSDAPGTFVALTGDRLQPVPEPASGVLLGGAIGILAAARVLRGRSLR